VLIPLPLGEPGIQWAMNPDIYPFTELKLRFQDFCRLKRVVLISQALAPEWELDPSKGKLILNLNLYLFKVVLYSPCVQVPGESQKIHAVNWWSVCQPWQEEKHLPFVLLHSQTRPFDLVRRQLDWSPGLYSRTMPNPARKVLPPCPLGALF